MSGPQPVRGCPECNHIAADLRPAFNAAAHAARVAGRARVVTEKHLRTIAAAKAVLADKRNVLSQHLHDAHEVTP